MAFVFWAISTVSSLLQLANMAVAAKPIINNFFILIKIKL